METIVVNSAEYTALKMNAFDANKLLIRINKIVLPVMANMGKGIDTDFSKISDVLVQNLNEEVMDSIIFPLLNFSKVYSAEKKMFIKDAASMNMCYTVETLPDFYLLIWEVLKLNYESFFHKVAANFGDLTASLTAEIKS